VLCTLKSKPNNLKNKIYSMKNLTRTQMKNINGGLDSGSGTCCAHSADWGYEYCNVDKATAMSKANEYASTSGHSGYWCCDSCNQQLPS
jgi:hypothetical protein